MRIDVEIPESQLKQVDALASSLRLTREETVRRGLDRLLAEPIPPHPMSRAAEKIVFDEVFGSWKGSGIDGLEWQRKLRAEWDDDAIVE